GAAAGAADRPATVADRAHAHRARGLPPGPDAGRGAEPARRAADAARVDGQLLDARGAADLPARAVPAGRGGPGALRLSPRRDVSAVARALLEGIDRDVVRDPPRGPFLPGRARVRGPLACR